MKNKLAFFIMRVLLGLVFLLFGIGKFQNDIWAQTIKTMDIVTKLPWSVDVTVFLIGIEEVIVGIALITGLFTRFFSAIAALSLVAISFAVKFAEIRDVGLLGAALYMAFVNDDSFGIGQLWKR